MIRPRGYTGSISQLRRVVAELRPTHPEAFLRLHGEMAQADWAHFGDVSIGRAARRLSAFVLTLCYSRALWLEFFFDQCLENFLLGHVHAFITGSERPARYGRTTSAEWSWSATAMPFTSTPASWNSPRTTTSTRARAAPSEEMKKGASNGPFSMYVILLRRVSLHHPCRFQPPGSGGPGRSLLARGTRVGCLRDPESRSHGRLISQDLASTLWEESSSFAARFFPASRKSRLIRAVWTYNPRIRS
jgi:hypothetical protein